MKYNIYVADFETNNSNDNNIESNVYLSGISELYSNETKLHINIDDFMSYIFTLENPLIYFHNGGKFDTFFILSWLIKNDFIESQDKKINKKYSMFSSNNIIYSLNIYYYDKKITIRDSYRLITYSVAKLGGKEQLIDYSIRRNYSNINQIPKIEKEYIESDIYHVKNALKSDSFYTDIPGQKDALSITIASHGFKLQKENIEIVKFQTKGILTEKQWDYYYNFLEGGLVKVEDSYILNLYKPSKYSIFDVNSEYPYICTLPLPFGKPLLKPPKIGPYTTYLKIYIKSFKIKDNYPLYIRKIKQNGVKEFIKQCKTPDWYFFIDEEFELIKEIYELQYDEKHIEKTYFSLNPYFKDMIEYLYSLRKKYKTNNDKLNEQMIKLLMNSGFFGKHCQNRHTEENYLKEITWEEYTNLPKNSKKITNEQGKYFHFTTKTTETRQTDLSYVVLGAYITAKARLHIFKYWKKLHYCFVYSDTDSIIIDKTKITKEDLIWLEQEISQTELGKLKHEGDVTEVAFRAPKNYKIDNIIKSAGFHIDNNKLKLTTLQYAESSILKNTKTYIRNVNLTKSIEKIDGKLQGKFKIDPWWYKQKINES